MDDNLDIVLPESVPRNERELERDLEQGRVYRLNDKFFKFAFGKPERKALFLDLINSIIFPDSESAFTDITFVDREFSPLRSKGKECRLDIVGTLDGGEQINVEVQVRNEGDYEKRSVCNWSIVHFSQFESGMMYVDAKRTITINILAFDLLKGEPGFRNSYSVRNDASGGRLCEDLCIIYLEIPKYRRAGRKPVNKLERWMAYLAGQEGEEMSKIAEKEPMIGTAIDVEKMFLMDHKQRLAYVLSWKEMMDEGNRQRRHELEIEKAQAEIKKVQAEKGKAQAEKEKAQAEMEKAQAEKEKARKEAQGAMQQGIEQGIEKGLAQTARKMLSHGMEMAVISDLTGFSEDELKELK